MAHLARDSKNARIPFPVVFAVDHADVESALAAGIGDPVDDLEIADGVDHALHLSAKGVSTTDTLGVVIEDDLIAAL